MQCPGKHLKTAAIISLSQCVSNLRQHLPMTCQVSLIAATSHALLICSCGSGCILHFREEGTAQLWESSFLTDPRAALRGAISSGTLLLLSMPSTQSMMTASHARARQVNWATIAHEVLQRALDKSDASERLLAWLASTGELPITNPSPTVMEPA